MGRGLNYVKSFRIDYERDENWRTFYPNRDYQSVSRTVHGLKISIFFFFDNHCALLKDKVFLVGLCLDENSTSPGLVLAMPIVYLCVLLDI